MAMKAARKRPYSCILFVELWYWDMNLFASVFLRFGFDVLFVDGEEEGRSGEEEE